jgi:hypothetical protein
VLNRDQVIELAVLVEHAQKAQTSDDQLQVADWPRAGEALDALWLAASERGSSVTRPARSN